MIGCFERRGEAVFNSAVVIEGGVFRGYYAKTYPIESGCSPGTDFPVWKRAGRTFGINIRNDTNYRDVADRHVAQGADLICCPINMVLKPVKAEIWREESLAHMRSCARRRSAGTCAATPSAKTRMVARIWLYGDHRPDGSVIGQAVEGVQDVVMADIP